jgi:hypothetical protein
MHLTGAGDTPLWQPRYYDRIIRNEKGLNNIRDYIANNVITWAFDKETPEDVLFFFLKSQNDIIVQVVETSSAFCIQQ